MKRKCVVAVGLLLLVALLAPVPASAQGRNQNPQILPPFSHAYGMSYADWSVRWWQWIFSLPANSNPVVDYYGTVDCSVGQSGHVWFLAGAFTPDFLNPTLTTVTRECVIPPGTALFFPLYNAWADNTGCPYTEYSEDELKGFMNWYMDNAPQVSATVDGVPVAGVEAASTSRYRVGPQIFQYELADSNNIIASYFSPYADCIADGLSVSPAAEDGVYLMLAPLSAGKHTIHFEVAGFLDVTYELTVRK